jgi:hypothetical protein
MARKQDLATHLVPSRGGTKRNSFITTTGCFIVGIFLTSSFFLYGLHYSVQISSFFQQHNKDGKVFYSTAVEPGLMDFIPALKNDFVHKQTSVEETKQKDDDDAREAPKSQSVSVAGGERNQIYVKKSEVHVPPQLIDGEPAQVKAPSLIVNTYAYSGEEETLFVGKKKRVEDKGADGESYGYEEKTSSPGNLAPSEVLEDAGSEYGEIETEIEVKPDVEETKNNEKEVEGEYASYGEEEVENGGGNEQEAGEGEGEEYGEIEAVESKTVKPNNYLRSEKVGVPAVVKAKLPSKGKHPKKRDPYNFVREIDPNWGVKGEWDLKFIEVLPTKKVLLKRDRRVVFPNGTLHFITHPGDAASSPTGSGATASRASPSGIPGMPQELMKANEKLKHHPLFDTSTFDKNTHSLEEVMYFLKNTPQCSKQPVYLTMATVGDDLYWQLIENFVYTLVKFEVVDCALVICVSDSKCMEMCDAAYFPCFKYESAEKPLPSVMEQIAQVKLLHVPKALSSGVDVFMLDLDVGFLENPSLMVQAFVETPVVDIFVQVNFFFETIYFKYLF